MGAKKGNGKNNKVSKNKFGNGKSEDNSNSKKIWYYFGFALVVAIIVALLVYAFMPDDVSHFTSSIDGKNYAIRDKGTPEIKQGAADYLSNLSRKVDILVSYMKEKNLPDQEIANRLYHRWRKCKLRETSSNESSAAYTVNKGEEMRICIRSDGELENPNTSMFVILHELGHMASVSFGHNSEFRENFSYLVHLASALGLYHPENFTNSPTSYCGSVVINTTPCSQGTCAYGVINHD